MLRIFDHRSTALVRRIERHREFLFPGNFGRALSAARAKGRAECLLVKLSRLDGDEALRRWVERTATLPQARHVYFLLTELCVYVMDRSPGDAFYDQIAATRTALEACRIAVGFRVS